jgi:hypothetical protein
MLHGYTGPFSRQTAEAEQTTIGLSFAQLFVQHDKLHDQKLRDMSIRIVDMYVDFTYGG